MAIKELGECRLSIHCSSSISNFKDKIKNPYLFKDLFQGKKVKLFIGMYHLGDYLKFLFFRGDKYIFWCGSDILNLTQWKVKFLKAKKHFCENKIEQEKLKDFGIEAKIHPSFFKNPDDYPICYRHSYKPQVFVCMHQKREKEYGLQIIKTIVPLLKNITIHIYGIEGQNSKNLIFHGQVPEAQFDSEIRNYQAGLRLNKFDGFSEVLAKSLLLGQYPISFIEYPYVSHVTTLKELYNALENLKHKYKPNFKAKEYWYQQLTNPLCGI